MIVVPLFGFWLASSLAAYHNASQWLALLVGLALFPLVPLAWDLVFVWRVRRKPDPQDPVLTRLDRLVLRTLLVNALFLGAVLYTRPQTAFRALAVRGDWALDGQHAEWAERVRGGLLWLADQMEQRWGHAPDQTYGESDKAPTPRPPKPRPTPSPTPTPTPAPPPTPERDPTAWPMAAEVAPEVTAIPDESSIDAVGKYLASKITEPHRLVKALHDYVALRLTYDHPTADKITAHDYEHVPSQEAEAVFAAKTGVCSGYAHLLAALGKSAGIEIAYITGHARDSQQRVPETGDQALLASLDGYGHAWNAAHVGDDWLLIDATWDDDEHGPPRTTYLFTPPALFAYQHLPEDEQWQLLDTRLTPGDFVRQPLLTPIAGELGIALVDPARSQVTVDDQVAITLDNPQHARIAADLVADGAHDRRTDCVTRPITDAHPTITCKVASGQFEVRLYGISQQDSPDEHAAMHLEYFGSLQVNGR